MNTTVKFLYRMLLKSLKIHDPVLIQGHRQWKHHALQDNTTSVIMRKTVGATTFDFNDLETPCFGTTNLMLFPWKPVVNIATNLLDLLKKLDSLSTSVESLREILKILTKSNSYGIWKLQMSPVKRICVFEHSVMTNFNCACPAIQRGQGSGFLSEGSSRLTACMSEQRRFWRDCADAQARLNLRCSHRR